MEDKIERQIDILRSNSSLGVISYGIEYESGWIWLPSNDSHGEILDKALEFAGLWRYSTLMLRNSVLEEIVPLDEEAEGAGDAKLGIELAQITQYDFINEPLVLGGEPDRRLGASWKALCALHRLLDEYEELYAVYPQAHHSALSDLYRLEGQLRLQESFWSKEAILSQAQRHTTLNIYIYLTKRTAAIYKTVILLSRPPPAFLWYQESLLVGQGAERLLGLTEHIGR